MNSKRINNFLFILFLFFLTAGMVSTILYRWSPNNVIHLEDFQERLNRKEIRAKNTLYDIISMVKDGEFHRVMERTLNHDDISYYIFEEDEMVFWSDNHLDVSDLTSHDFTEWHFVELPNAYCVVLSQTIDNRNFIALITIKYNYPYENNKLVNRFARGFDMNKDISIIEGNESDPYAVFCMHGYYLFSLVEPDVAIYNELYAYTGSVAYLLAFFFFFILYFRFPYIQGKKLKISHFLCLFFSIGIMLCILLYFNVPRILFQNNVFTSFDYASLSILSSIAHLTVITGFIFFSACLFFFCVRMPKKMKSLYEIVLIGVYFVFFITLYAVLNSLIFHSSIQLNILQINNFSFMGVWAHFLLFAWGVSLALIFFKTHKYFAHRKKLRQAILYDLVFIFITFFVCLFISLDYVWLLVVPIIVLTGCFYVSYFFKKSQYSFVYLMICSFFYALFIISNLLQLNIEKNKCKYRVLAQNVFINGNIENDPIADILLEDLDKQLVNDSEAYNLLNNPESFEKLGDYLNKNYFRGFWDKYEVHINKASKYSHVYNDYMAYIDYAGSPIKDTHFYRVPTTQNAMTYVGIFVVPEANDFTYYFLEFYPRRQYRSYSFPDLLIPSSVNIHTQLNTAIAKYDNTSLTYSSGMVEYPADTEWIPEIEEDETSLFYDGHWHYIYQPNESTYIVVSKQKSNDIFSYLVFWLYLAIIYFVLSWLLVKIFKWTYQQEINVGLTARFQYAFIFLLIVSFVTIFYVSVDFIKKRYEGQQIVNLENQKNYIQRALQDLYYFNQDLSAENMPTLNLDLLELSYTYQTDIHVFDNRGVLVGSSLPLIFNRHLISNRMPSVPYFSADPNMEHYENIGDLNYLVAYTDFYNGDYLQIGYIAVPLYLSQKEMHNEIENFTSVIIHIYLVIIMLAVFLTLVIGQRLSAPLIMLEKKLKEMRLGRGNEKIDYKPNDEIGQLVAQYNRTVDELEQSAKLLAESERESAWRSMARQVAHEINNPLTPMKLSIQQLQRRKGMEDDNFDEYFKQTTEILIEQIDTLSRIAGTFSDFARMPEAHYDNVDITSVLRSVVNLFANNTQNSEIIYKGIKKSIFIYADSEQLIQVFNNLIKNAVQSIPQNKKGKIVVDLYEKKDRIIICIQDNGTGIPEDIQDKLFVPNFTTKSQGMGLGLAISKNIIQQLNGTIHFRTQNGAGSTFIITIPVKK